MQCDTLKEKSKEKNRINQAPENEIVRKDPTV